MKRVVLFIFCSLMVVFSHAQQVAWEKNYDFLQTVSLAQGICYSKNDSIIGVVAAESDNSASGRIMFLNSTTGDTIKTIKFGNKQFMAGFSSPIKSLPNGGYIVAVSDTFNNSNSTDTTYTRLIKIDSALNVVWDKRFVTNRRDNAPKDIYVINNNEYYIFQESGNAHLTGFENYRKYTICYYNENTNQYWYKIFDFTQGDINSNKILKNGINFTLFGDYLPLNAFKPLLIKINSNGDSITSKHLFTDETDVFAYYSTLSNAISTPNNNIILCGVRDSSFNLDGTEYPYICKIDSNFNIKWKSIIRNIKTYNYGFQANYIALTENDTIYLANFIAYQSKLRLVKIDSKTGSIIDSLVFTSSIGTYTSFITDIIHNENDLYFSGRCNYGTYQSFVLKISGVGKPATSETTGTKKYPTFAIKSSVTLYPNPTSDVLNVEVEGGGIFELYNALGQKVHTEPVKGKTQIDVSEYPVGCYEYQYHTKTYMQGGKIVINR